MTAGEGTRPDPSDSAAGFFDDGIGCYCTICWEVLPCGVHWDDDGNRVGDGPTTPAPDPLPPGLPRWRQWAVELNAEVDELKAERDLLHRALADCVPAEDYIALRTQLDEAKRLLRSVPDPQWGYNTSSRVRWDEERVAFLALSDPEGQT